MGSAEARSVDEFTEPDDRAGDVDEGPADARARAANGQQTVRNGVTQEQFVEKVRAEVRALGAPPTFVDVLPLTQTYEGLKLYCEQVPA